MHLVMSSVMCHTSWFHWSLWVCALECCPALDKGHLLRPAVVNTCHVDASQFIWVVIQAGGVEKSTYCFLSSRYLDLGSLKQVDLSGVANANENNKEATSKGIKAYFNMDDSGILSLDKVWFCLLRSLDLNANRSFLQGTGDAFLQTP